MNQPQSLRDLMNLAVAKHQTSVRQLGFIAQKQGFKVVYTTLNHIRSGSYKSVPSPETLKAIAWLAGVDDSVAFTAAGQPVPGPPFAEELPPGVDNLPPKARKAAIDMLRVLVDMNQDADHAVNAEEQEQPADVGGAGAQPGNPRAGQKTVRGLSAVPNVERLDTNNHDGGNIPLPDDYEQLAAHPAIRSSGLREHEAGRERGEESQDQTD